MKVKTSPYERAINRLAQGTPKDCDLADELEQACRASMKERLAIEARIAAAVAAERERLIGELANFYPLNDKFLLSIQRRLRGAK